MGLLAEYIRKKFGHDLLLEGVPEVISVGTTATQLCPANPDRLMLVIQVIGANDVYIHPNERVSTSLGLLCPANGGGWVFTAEEDGEMVGLPWWGISTAATNVYVAAVVGR